MRQDQMYRNSLQVVGYLDEDMGRKRLRKNVNECKIPVVAEVFISLSTGPQIHVYRMRTYRTPQSTCENVNQQRALTLHSFLNAD